GIATTIPAHVAILEHPDFAAARHSTKWVEEALDLSGVGPPAAKVHAEAPAPDDTDGRVQRDVDVEVDGRRYRVRLWVPDVAALSATGPARPSRPRPAGGGGGGGGAGA